MRLLELDDLGRRPEVRPRLKTSPTLNQMKAWSATQSRAAFATISSRIG
jgi:hypothetical protein